MRSFAAIVLLVAAGLWAGCSAADDEQAGRTLRVQSSRIRGFDPVKVSDLPSGLAIGRVYEGLLQHAYLERPYRVEPLLAAAMPEVSSDQLTYTFRLRQGIHFSDDPCFAATGGKGREVTADDVVYSLKRLADRKTGSIGYWVINGRIKGLDAFREASGEPAPTDYAADVEGLRALDRYTVRLELTKPYAQLLWVLAMHHCVVVAREAVERYGDAFATHPVGTGPYVLKDWRRNYSLTFERNPTWRETGRVETYPARGGPGDEEAGLLADAGKPIPFIDRIVTYHVADPSTQWLMFLRGGLDVTDIARDNWNVVLDSRRQLLPEIRQRGIKLYTGPEMSIGYIGFNMDDPVLGRNRKLRQAMTSAFNGQDWLKLSNFRALRPTGPVPGDIAGKREGPLPYEFDLERAKRLLAEAGYPEGRDPATGNRLEITLDIGRADDLELRQSAELFVSFMDKIGIVIRPVYNNWPTFLDKLDRRQVQLYTLRWIADYPDADNFLQLFHSRNASPGPNHSNYVNPEFDKLYDQASVLPDSPERTRLYREMQERVVEDCPWIFTADLLVFILQQPRVHNYKMHPFAVGLEKYYRLEL
jgi:oligopeptide transport system substrate-binding protein